MRAVFGGSFDPVHIGHLRMATELAEALDLDQVALMPCYQPVHKHGLGASAAQRLAMLERAVIDNPRLSIDRRELDRGAYSYSIDSVRSLREEAPGPVIMVMGSDSAAGLASWREAEQFASQCHLVVIERPLPQGGEQSWKAVCEALGFCRVAQPQALHGADSGLYLPLRLNLLEVSSTFIRNAVKQNRSIRYLVTDAVERYICDNGLYQANLGGSPR